MTGGPSGQERPPRTSTPGYEDFVSALPTEFGLSLTPPEARMLVATLWATNRELAAAREPCVDLR
ncbi:MAG: hypothetical protein SYR96_10860 [Actinomycetota bacterium]|nr:hypothetical protein [Actinomycetota bacterium]